LTNIKTPLINAGDGTLDHPTQTLLDLLTIYQEFEKFKNLTVLIVGDILHSRVAHSNIKAMKRCGMKVLISAPKEFQDKQYQYIDFETGLKQADVVNMLRIQNERLDTKMSLSINTYVKQYGLNLKRVNMMKPKAIIIHPAPVNRNIEISDDVVECDKSRIFKQIQNGVFVRMAVLERAFKK
jgi:aspartate carbamoyltransferase catalytic subunit